MCGQATGGEVGQDEPVNYSKWVTVVIQVVVVAENRVQQWRVAFWTHFNRGSARIP